MKYLMVLLTTLLCVSCASTDPRKEYVEYNFVSHETLGQDFVNEKNTVCNHFKKSGDMLVLRKNYMAKYYDSQTKDEVSKLSQFEVNKTNVPGWHCGETAWKISQRISDEVALGRDVPIKSVK